MKDLLAAIKVQLQAEASYVRKNDIYITEDESLIPATTNFPAIAIKDGALRNEQRLAGNYIQHAQVRITIYQRVLKPEESIMGAQGVLVAADDIINSLIGHKLNLADVKEAFPVAEDPSQLFVYEEEMIQKKTITFAYTIHKTW